MLNGYEQSERMLIVLGIGLLIGLVLGYWMQQESKKRLKVRGGQNAEIFHYLAGSVASGLIPMIFMGLFNGLHFLRLVASGLTFGALTSIFLLGYAYFESQAKMETTPQIELD